MPKDVMTIRLNVDTGELIGVWYNEKTVVEGVPLDKKSPAVLKTVPMSPSNFSVAVYSHGSPGCWCYIVDGRRYCVPPN